MARSEESSRAAGIMRKELCLSQRKEPGSCTDTAGMGRRGAHQHQWGPPSPPLAQQHRRGQGLVPPPQQCPGAPAEGSDDPQTDQLRSTCVSTWSPPGTQRGRAQGLSQEDAWTVESRIQCPQSKSSPQPERVTHATPWGKASTPYPCSSLHLRSQPASLSLSLALPPHPPGSHQDFLRFQNPQALETPRGCYLPHVPLA